MISLTIRNTKLRVPISKRIDRRILRSLEALARRMEASLRDAFLAAIRSAKSKATLTVIEQAMRDIDPAAAIREATAGLEFGRMRETLAQLVEASGVRATAALVPITGQIIASFTIMNPYAAQYARSSVGEMIREITHTTQLGIQNVIENAVSEGVAPRIAAQQIRTMIGLTSRQTDWAINYETKLLASGATDIDVKVARYTERLLRQRAMNISRSETLRAVNFGQQAAWKSAVDQGLIPSDVEQVWIATKPGLGRTCEICLDLDGQKTQLNGIFTASDGVRIKGPPEHPSCRCTLALDI